MFTFSGLSKPGPKLIKHVSLSADAYVDLIHGVDGVILDGTFHEYILEWVRLRPSSSGPGRIRTSSNLGVSFAATNGDYSSYYSDGSANNSANGINIGAAASLDTTNGSTGCLRLKDIHDTTKYKFFSGDDGYDNGGFYGAYIGGSRKSNAAINALRIIQANPAHTLTGEVFLWGSKKR